MGSSVAQVDRKGAVPSAREVKLAEVPPRMPASLSICPNGTNKYSGWGGLCSETRFTSQPLKKPECKTLSFYSLNSQHCQAVATNLRVFLSGQDRFICFLQEPFVRKGKVHSILWGTESNARGEALEIYLFTHSLKLENVGCRPTFVARGTQTCIDVTISPNLSPLMIEGWEVSKAITMSDHRRIEFYLSLKSKPKRIDAPLGAVNWDDFTKTLRGIKVTYPKFITKRWIDVMAAKLEADIKKALHAACPVRRGKHKVNRPVHWSKVVEQ